MPAVKRKPVEKNRKKPPPKPIYIAGVVRSANKTGKKKKR
jgi:hypothetical protein